MKRIFIGLKVDPGEILMEMISAFKTGLATEPIKWTDTANIHITLVFLGNTEEERIPQLRSMLKEICGGRGRFDLTLKGAGVFRNMNDPRILWTGIGSSQKLLQLNEAITAGLIDLGFEIEDRPYKPHLTLGRIKRINEKEAFSRLIEKYCDTAIQTVNVNEVIMFESVLLQTGPLYRALERVSL
jgi:2'-5' RNA ligase